MRVEFAPSGVADLRDIEDFLHRPSRQSAEFSALMHDAISHLERWPGTATSRADLTNLDVVFWFAHPYHLVMKRESERLVVIAILHSSRNIRRELRKRLGKKPS